MMNKQVRFLSMDTQNTTKENQAIDLMIEDLHTCHTGIRIEAKKIGCEEELEKLKNQLVDYLHQIRS